MNSVTMKSGGKQLEQKLLWYLFDLLHPKKLLWFPCIAAIVSFKTGNWPEPIPKLQK